MSENTEIVSNKETHKETRNLFSLFPKIKFDFPFPRPEPSRKPVANGGAEGKKAMTAVSDEGQTGKESVKPSVVRFPKTHPIVPPPLETETEEPNKTSNPVILWQVYALGGFLILRWVWARWNERKSGGKSGDEKGSPEDDNNDTPSGI